MDTSEGWQSPHLIRVLVLELGALQRGARPQRRMTHWRQVPGSSPHARLLRGEGPALHLWPLSLLWCLLQAGYTVKTFSSIWHSPCGVQQDRPVHIGTC